MNAETVTIALAGNPNSGKTTIFNNLTGTRQKVGNWPGVTVEKKEGLVRRNGRELRIVDLPGVYSLTPFSIEEIVTRNYLLDDTPDVVIVIIDASNLERSLYLATQLRELDCKVMFALNMADLAEERGMKIDADKLSDLLNIPVVFTVGNRDTGTDELLKSALELADKPDGIPKKRRVKYDRDIEAAISVLRDFIVSETGGLFLYDPRWTAIKLLEDDRIIKERFARNDAANTVLQTAGQLREQLRDRYNDDPEIVMTDMRYGFIAGIVKEVLVIASSRHRVDVSRNIDLILTNRFLGFPLFIFFIWAMFQLTFRLGEYPRAAVEYVFSALSSGLSTLLPAGLFQSLLVDGVIAGVGSVAVFLPNILILFFCIALFEDTGYMSRAAFLMDRIMHCIGLHGKSFIPMLMGFGCNVPAVMATRTLESEKDRILTILITPFMSCSAKLPVYIVLAGAFFGVRAGSVIFGIYLTGVLVSMISGRIFRSFLLKGEDAPFVMELPPYRAPMLKSLLIHMWDRAKIFLRKMTGVILVGSLIVWALSTFPRPDVTPGETATAPFPKAAVETSFLGMIGKGIAPVFDPIGIDWRGGVALLTGFVAKEIVVSTLGVLHAGEETDSALLQNILKTSGMTPLSALSMMVFVLLYVPCIATVSVIRRETGSFRWTLFSIAYSTGIAWLLAFTVYQGGRLLGYA